MAWDLAFDDEAGRAAARAQAVEDAIGDDIEHIGDQL